MTTLTIEIEDTDKKKVLNFIAGLGGKVVSDANDNTSSKAKKKKQILDDLESSIEFVKLHQAGKVEAKSIEELLNEL